MDIGSTGRLVFLLAAISETRNFECLPRIDYGRSQVIGSQNYCWCCAVLSRDSPDRVFWTHSIVMTRDCRVVRLAALFCDSVNIFRVISSEDCDVIVWRITFSGGF